MSRRVCVLFFCPLEIEMRRELKIVVGTLCLLVTRSLQAQTIAESELEANPGRPTVSTPATLTPVDYLKFENGLLYAEQSPEFSTRTSINQVTKLAVSSRLQALLLIEPLVHSQGDGSNTENHVGEVFLGVQGVLLPGKRRRPTVSASYIYRLHASPAPEIDIGTFRQSAIVLVSDDLLGFHFDLNVIASEQEGNGLRRGAVWADAIGFPSRGAIYRLGRDMAFFAAADGRQRCGQSVGGFLSGAEESCCRCRIRAWPYQHIDAMGGFWRVYLPAAASAVARETVSYCCSMATSSTEGRKREKTEPW